MRIGDLVWSLTQVGCDGRYEATWEKFQLMVMTFTISTLVTIMITVSTLVTTIQTLKHSKCYFGHFIYFAYFGLVFRGKQARKPRSYASPKL